MRIFQSTFDLSAVDAFAARVVEELIASVPPDRLDETSKKASQRREALDQRLRRLASEFASSRKLNLYQKAKIGDCLETQMAEAGYSEAFRKPFAYDVVKLVAVAASQRR